MSAGSLIQPRRRRRCSCFSPRPSMSKARRRDEMVQVLDALERAGELAGAAAHHASRRPTAVVSRTSGVFSGHGQMGGKVVRLGRRPLRSGSTTPTICGITSPARCRITVSPMRTSWRAISSALCRVALLHHHAADGDRMQPGHRRQRRRCGRPGCRWPPAPCVACWAGNLWAMAQRGVRDDEAQPLPASPAGRPCRPRRRCHSRGSAGRASMLVVERQQAVGVLDAGAIAALTWKPQASAPPAPRPGSRANGALSLAPGVGEEAQRPRGGDRRIDLAQRAGGGVARVGVGASARPPRPRR